MSLAFGMREFFGIKRKFAGRVANFWCQSGLYIGEASMCVCVCVRAWGPTRADEGHRIALGNGRALCEPIKFGGPHTHTHERRPRWVNAPSSRWVNTKSR